MDVDVSLALATPPRPVQGGRRSPPGTTETAAGAWCLLLVSAPAFDFDFAFFGILRFGEAIICINLEVPVLKRDDGILEL